MRHYSWYPITDHVSCSSVNFRLITSFVSIAENWKVIMICSNSIKKMSLMITYKVQIANKMSLCFVLFFFFVVFVFVFLFFCFFVLFCFVFCLFVVSLFSFCFCFFGGEGGEGYFGGCMFGLFFVYFFFFNSIFCTFDTYLKPHFVKFYFSFVT